MRAHIPRTHIKVRSASTLAAEDVVVVAVAAVAVTLDSDVAERRQA